MIVGDIRPQLGKNTYKLVGVIAKAQHWRLLQNCKQVVDLGGDGSVTFNQGSVNKDYVIEVTITDKSNIQHVQTLAIKPIAGKPSIQNIKWQDEYYQDLNGRFVGYSDKVRLFIHTINIPVGDRLQVTIWEDEALDGHSDKSRNMGTYTTSPVDKWGKAELFFSNTEVYMKILNDKDYINEDVHEFYAEVKYLSKFDSIQDTIQLRILNQVRKMIEPPKNNSVATVYVPDKQKKPEQKTGVKVTVNVYFDGTLNNADNTKARLSFEKKEKGLALTANEQIEAKAFDANDEDDSSYDNYYSNVAIMRMINIVKPENREIKIYVEGEGTDKHQEDDTMGYAFGAGDTGIPAKVNKAFQKIKEGIDVLKKNNSIAKDQFVNEIDLTVFGFSRGAAAARNFIAKKYRLQDEYNIETTKFNVTFVGLYDTVSSYEKEGNFSVLGSAASHDFDDDVEELKLKLENHVKKVVHLIASDEYRENFSLTNIKSSIEAGVGFELELPGVHSDIGGGYAEIENETRYLHLEKGYTNIKQELIQQGWYLPKQIVEMKGHQTVLWAKREGIPNSFQYIPLEIMITLAEKHGLVFDKVNLVKGALKDLYVVPSDLEDAKSVLVAYAKKSDGAVSKKATIPIEHLKPIRNKYLHRSTSDSIGKGGRYKDGKPDRKHHDG